LYTLGKGEVPIAEKDLGRSWCHTRSWYPKFMGRKRGEARIEDSKIDTINKRKVALMEGSIKSYSGEKSSGRAQASYKVSWDAL